MLSEAKKEDSVYVKRIIIRKKSRWAIIRPYLEALLLVFMVCLANALAELLTSL
jgi:non-homologous end joining protein Ku